ncbi:MAG: hypothetical protein RIB98_19640, partial [Acidimicrobiales bacterium]
MSVNLSLAEEARELEGVDPVVGGALERAGRALVSDAELEVSPSLAAFLERGAPSDVSVRRVSAGKKAAVVSLAFGTKAVLGASAAAAAVGVGVEVADVAEVPIIHEIVAAVGIERIVGPGEPVEIESPAIHREEPAESKPATTSQEWAPKRTPDAEASPMVEPLPDADPDIADAPIVEQETDADPDVEPATTEDVAEPESPGNSGGVPGGGPPESPGGSGGVPGGGPPESPGGSGGVPGGGPPERSEEHTSEL